MKTELEKRVSALEESLGELKKLIMEAIEPGDESADDDDLRQRVANLENLIVDVVADVSNLSVAEVEELATESEPEAAANGDPEGAN